MNTISIKEFLKIDKNSYQLIDIREKYEYDNGNLGCINIPMGEVLSSIEKITKSKKVIIYCQSGRRGASVVYMLKKTFNLDNIFNLKGGYQEFLDVKLKIQ